MACAIVKNAVAMTYRNVSLPGGVRLSTLFGGAAGGGAVETIVFLHGFPEGSWAWHGVFESGDLDAFQLVAPDLPGYNASSLLGPVSTYAVDALVADVVALIDAVVAGSAEHRVHLVAHDWGGALAWWLAAAHPGTLLSLTIVNMAHPLGWIEGIRTDPVQQAASAYVLDFVNPAFTAVLTAGDNEALKLVFLGEAFFDADGAAYAESWRHPGTVDAALNWYRANVMPRCPLNCTAPACFQQGVASAFDAMPAAGITPAALPVAVLWGMRDAAFDNEFQLAYMASKVRGRLDVTRFANNTHWLPQEEPGAVAAAIAAFVGTAAAATTAAVAA